MSCEYCEHDTMANYFDGDGFDDPHVYVLNGWLVMEHEGVLDSVRINNCPMCGDGLWKEGGND